MRERPPGRGVEKSSSNGVQISFGRRRRFVLRRHSDDLSKSLRFNSPSGDIEGVQNPAPHSDRLFEFSHLVFKIKVIILELVIFVGFLMFMWDKVKKDVTPPPKPPA